MILSHLILSNGGMYTSHNRNIFVKNTCSVDYFLMIVYIIYNNHQKHLDGRFCVQFSKIHEFIRLNNWYFARLEWMKFSNLDNYIVTNDSHEFLLIRIDSYKGSI